jgi:hypothetical protein
MNHTGHEGRNVRLAVAQSDSGCFSLGIRQAESGGSKANRTVSVSVIGLAPRRIEGNGTCLGSIFQDSTGCCIAVVIVVPKRFGKHSIAALQPDHRTSRAFQKTKVSGLGMLKAVLHLVFKHAPQ